MQGGQNNPGRQKNPAAKNPISTAVSYDDSAVYTTSSNFKAVSIAKHYF